MPTKNTLLTLSAAVLILGSMWLVSTSSTESASASSNGDSLATMKTAPASGPMSSEEALKRVMEMKFNKKNCNNPPRDLQQRIADAQFYIAVKRPGGKEYQDEKKLADTYIQFKNECSKRRLIN